MRKKQKQKAPQSALETLLLVLLAALTPRAAALT